MASSTVSIPKTMKGVVINRTGGPEVLEFKTDLPVPTPKEGEVLVKNEYAAINYIDTYFRSGLYPSQMPNILGKEGEGTIASLGSTSSSTLSPGDRVAYLGASTYAEYSVVPSTRIFPIPSSFPPQVAAASLLQGLTALTLIEEAHKVEKGQWVLVHAASGGVGLWLCQLLKIYGARIIGTASTQEKIDEATKNGAEFMINYSSNPDWVTEVKRIVKENTGEGEEQGVHVVFDGVGKSTFEGGLEVLRRKGSMISFGNASGSVPPFAIARLSPKNIHLMRPQLFGFITTSEEFDHYVSLLFSLVEKHKLDTKIWKVYPLKDVKLAHEDLEGRKTMGKLLLKI